MRMVRLFITTLILLLLPALALAEGEIHAGDVVGRMLDRQAALLSAQGKTLVREGDIVVEQAGDYQAVTTPFLSIRHGDRRWVIGMLAMNVASAQDGGWRMAVALPTPLRLMEENQTIATIEFSDQTTDIVVNGQTGDISSVTARFGPIGVTSVVNGLIGSLGGLDVIRTDADRFVTRLHDVQGDMIAPDGTRHRFISLKQVQSSHNTIKDGWTRQDEWQGLDIDWRDFSFALDGLQLGSVYQAETQRLALVMSGDNLQTGRGEVEKPLSLTLQLRPVGMTTEQALHPFDILTEAEEIVIQDSVMDLPDIGLNIDAHLTRYDGGLIPYHGRADFSIAGAQALGDQAVDHQGLSFILGFLPMISLIGENAGQDEYGRPVTRFSFRSAPDTGILANGRNIDTLLDVIFEGVNKKEDEDGNPDNTGTE